MAILELKDVSYHYKNNKQKQILNNNSMAFERGLFYVIVGVSGSGKTTLLSLLAGLDEPQNGDILFDGVNIQKQGLLKHRRDHISIVFQNYNLIDYMTPKENLRLIKHDADLSLLEQLGLDKDDINRNVLHLSGGQQQRVAIARSLVSDAPIILADEPTGNLDSDTAEDIILTLKEYATKLNKCVIVVTHSKQLATQADVILRLKKGVLYEI